MTPARVRDARETHFTCIGRRSTQFDRLDRVLETGRVKRTFVDPPRHRKLKIDHLHNIFGAILFPETPVRYYNKHPGNLPRQDGTATRSSTRSGSHYGWHSHTRRNESQARRTLRKCSTSNPSIWTEAEQRQVSIETVQVGLRGQSHQLGWPGARSRKSGCNVQDVRSRERDIATQVAGASSQVCRQYVLKPLTDLLISDMAWIWSTNQVHAFEQLKIIPIP